MMKKQFFGQDGVLLPNAIYVPKGEEIAISKDWLIFPEAISGEGKVWTIDGRLEPIQKQDNEMWVCTYQDQEFKEPLQYKTKNAYNWHVVEVSCENELDYVDKKNIKHLIISNNLKTIKDEEFLDCHGLKTIKIPDSVTYIGNRAFAHCYELHNIVIPDSVTDIGGGVFSSCNTLKSVTLPNTLKELKSKETLCEDGTICGEAGFFQECGYLEHIKLPDNLITLGTYAFSQCHSLKNIVFPNTLETIEHRAFEACGIESIIIPNSVTDIGSEAFARCHFLRNVILSENLQIMPEYLFIDCHSLTSIIIPDKVTEIGDYAFANTGLQKLTIGKNVNFIRYGVFWNTHLYTITSYASTPPQLQGNTFANVDRGLNLIVPDPELYRNAEYWNEFYNIYTINPYEVNITSANEDWGTVDVEFNSLEEVHINAIAKDGFKFKQWSDGITDSWRSISPTGDINLIAEFEKPYQCEIVNLQIIDITPTSVTVRFEVTCNEERDTLECVQVCVNNGEFCGNVQYKPGVQETTIEGLQPETMYQIKVVVMNDVGYWVGRYLEFTTPSLLYPSLSYSYVDLGLPSGLKWADRNVGAETPQDNGLYFSWGNVDGHAVDENGNVSGGYSFDYDTYSTTPGSQYTDSTLDAEHDAATVNMGEEWRMPTVDEIFELVENTNHYYISEDGNIVAGPFNYETNYEDKGLDSSKLRSICFVKKSEEFDYDNRSNFIEFPFAGHCDGSLCYDDGYYGNVWSSSVVDYDAVRQLYFGSDGYIDSGSHTPRYPGNSVRGVKK